VKRQVHRHPGFQQETPQQDTPQQDTPQQDTPQQDTPQQDTPRTLPTLRRNGRNHPHK
jgi:hypothetical protein